MEIDDLKKTWSALDNVLMQNESLKNGIIKEILQSKTNKLLSRLTNYELIGTVICFVMLPFLFFMWGKIRHNLFADITIYVAGAMLIVGWITQPYKLYLLSKINFTKSIADNIGFVQRYNVFIKKEKIYICIITPILFGLILIALVGFGETTMWKWVFIISLFVFSGLMSYWQYKKFYENNIQSITKSLEELKELEEE